MVYLVFIMDSATSRKKGKSVKENGTDTDSKKPKKNLKRKSSEGSIASILTDASALNSGKKKKKMDGDKNQAKAEKMGSDTEGQNKKFEKSTKKPLKVSA